MDASRQATSEATIVAEVVAGVADLTDGEWGNRAWLHLFLDIEVGDGGRTSSICFSLAHRPGGPVERLAFRLPATAKRMFATLSDDMAGTGSRWTSARLTVERDGRYAIDYRYDPPFRLGGQLIDRRFEGYLDRWLESEAGAPFREPARPWWRRWTG